MRNTYKLPKKLMEKLARDLAELMDSEEGALLALQLLENLPNEAKISLISNLSMVYTPEVARFMALVLEEYPGEKLAAVAERSLKKLSLAGVPAVQKSLTSEKATAENFCYGLVSKTRLKGIVSLVLIFKNDENDKAFDAYFFTLCFSEMGIKEFFFGRELNDEQIAVIMTDENYGKIDYIDSLTLLKLAYDCNLKYDSLPALGIFIYKSLIKQTASLPEDAAFNFYHILAQEVNPIVLTNGICLAIRTEDYRLLDYLTENQRQMLPEIGLLLESKVLSCSEEPDAAIVLVEIISEEENGLNRYQWTINYKKENNRWQLIKITADEGENLEWSWLEETLSLNNITCAYYVYQSHGVRLFIESLEGIEFFQESDDLDFYKWWDVDAIMEKGVSFKDTVLADLIIGEDELVVLASSEERLAEVKEILEAGLTHEIELLEEELPVEVVYKIFDHDKMSFSELIEQWMLTGSNHKDQLTTWLNTKLTELDGMTPLEASSSGEGSKLLWALFKKISQSDKVRGNYLVDYRALLRTVGWGKKVGKNIRKSR
ncbi:MAG: hypothetical protein SCK28_07720 [Bacillota bacterium]|nr:hypothetical protein [Bacillota bacterium]